MILHIHSNSFRHESRALREMNSVLHAGLSEGVCVIALSEDGVANHEIIDGRIDVWRCQLRSRSLPKNLWWQTFKYLEWSGQVLVKTSGEKLRVIHVHNLGALPLGVLLKLWHRARLVYDAHDLETEVQGMTGVRKRLGRLAEWILIRWADKTLVVSDTIADWYVREYRMERPTVLLNCPLKRYGDGGQPVDLRSYFALPEEALLFMYHGALFRGRGIESMLRLFSQADPSRHVVFMGYGELQGLIEDYSAKFGNIHFQPAVSPADVLRYTAGADVGIFFPDSACLNHQCTIPNKVFEYLAVSVPVIVSDFPGMGNFVRARGLGWTVPYGDDATLHNLISQLSRHDLDTKRAVLEGCTEDFWWEHDEPVLLAMYKDLMEP